MCLYSGYCCERVHLFVITLGTEASCMLDHKEGELLGCRFWKFFEHCTVFPTFDPCPSAAEHDEDDAIQDGQTDEKSHCEPHGGLHWTEVDMWQIMVITGHVW